MNPVIPPVRVVPTANTHRSAPREVRLLALVLCMVVALMSIVFVLYQRGEDTKQVAYNQCVSRNENVSRANDYYKRIANVIQYSTSLDEPTKKGLVTAFSTVQYPLVDCGQEP